MATGRERAADLAFRIVDEFRGTGILPPELIRDIQSSHARRTGEIASVEEVERVARRYAERICAKVDAERPILHGDDSIDEAVDILLTCSPKVKPERWAEAVATVEQAWKEGRLSPAQTTQLDALNAVYEAQAG